MESYKLPSSTWPHQTCLDWKTLHQREVRERDYKPSLCQIEGSKKTLPVSRTRQGSSELFFFFLKDADKSYSFPQIKLKDQLADILTKAVTLEAFEQTLCKLGISDPKI